MGCEGHGDELRRTVRDFVGLVFALRAWDYHLQSIRAGAMIGQRLWLKLRVLYNGNWVGVVSPGVIFLFCSVTVRKAFRKIHIDTQILYFSRRLTCDYHNLPSETINKNMLPTWIVFLRCGLVLWQIVDLEESIKLIKHAPQWWLSLSGTFERDPTVVPVSRSSKRKRLQIVPARQHHDGESLALLADGALRDHHG